MRTVKAVALRIWVPALIISVMIAGVLSSDESPLAMHAPATATVTPSATVTPTPTPTETATPTPTATSTPLPDRQNCDDVRGTKYRSPTEREWFLAGCVTPTVPAPTPVPQVEPAAAPPPQAPAASYSSLEELVCSYGWNCSWALSVMYCESGGNPDAYSPYGPYIGLFQLHASHGSNLFDPATNVAVAYSVYLSSGPAAWGACA